MTWVLWLDDERSCWVKKPDVFVAMSYAAAVKLVEELGAPYEVHLDHDLGVGPSGYDFAKWLIDQDLDGTIKLPANFEWYSQSANPAGRENIIRLFDNYFVRK